MSLSVMGIVNVTPDSFSDGGKFFTVEESVRRAKRLIDEGADIIDVGGESTRPGCDPIDWQDEWRRIENPLREIISMSGETRVSVDTYHYETASKAVDAGVDIVNCVYDRSVPAMMKLVSSNPQIEMVVPFRPGDSSETKWKIAQDAFSGLLPRLYLDPMIGFGTDRNEDLCLLRAIPELSQIGRVLIGASRKRIVRKLTGTRTVGKMLGGNLAMVAWAALNGASAVRVHDVKESVEVVKVLSVLNKE